MVVYPRPFPRDLKPGGNGEGLELGVHVTTASNLTAGSAKAILGD